MKKLRLWASAAFLIVIGLVVIVWWLNQGPFFKGRRLDAWLEMIDSGDPAQVSVARDAVRNLGHRALPRLTWLLKATDNDVPSLYKYREYAQTILGRHVQEIRAVDLNRWASLGFRTLGPNSVQTLIRLLSDPKPEVRTTAASLLAELGPEAYEATPALKGLLADAASTRRAALFALAQIGPKAAEALPEMIELLRRLRTPDAGPDVAFVVAAIDKIDSTARTKEPVVKETWVELEKSGGLMVILNAGQAVQRRALPVE